MSAWLWYFTVKLSWGFNLSSLEPSSTSFLSMEAAVFGAQNYLLYKSLLNIYQRGRTKMTYCKERVGTGEQMMVGRQIREEWEWRLNFFFFFFLLLFTDKIFLISLVSLKNQSSDS